MADIELVVKIPEEMYKWVNDVNKFFDDYGTSDFIDLVKNGTPLPKGHGRLIDADAFAVALKRISEKQGYSELYMNVDDVLNAVIDDLQGKTLYGYENCPTVEAIPKDQYEARLKADMVAMLEEILLEAEENTVRWYVGRVDGKSDDVVLMETLQEIIQHKINALKENNHND